MSIAAQLIVQYGEQRLREVRKPGPEMADPEEVNEVLARAKRILAKQQLLEMPTASKLVH